MIKVISKNFELIFWVTAVIALAVTNPVSAPHFALCVFRLAGISWCPGCGIGHAIAYLLHGNIAASWHCHWLGIPALAVIFYRIYSLSFEQMFNFKKLKLSKHGL